MNVGELLANKPLRAVCSYWLSEESGACPIALNREHAITALANVAICPACCVRHLANKIIPRLNNARESMHPDKTALLLIGFQNDYFAPDGILHSVIETSANTVKTVDNIVSLLQGLSNTTVSVVSTPICFTPDYEELVEPVGILKTIKEVGAFQAGSKGFEPIPELSPFQDNILEIPGKRGLNAFINTDLDHVLHQREINHLVLAGAVTSICIDSTGRAAHERNYQVSVLSDCTSARTVFEQDFYFENVFPLYGDTLTSSEFLDQLSTL